MEKTHNKHRHTKRLRGNKTNPYRYGSEHRKITRKQTPTNTNAGRYEGVDRPIDGWTFWTLVAGFVMYSGLLAFAVIWSIFH